MLTLFNFIGFNGKCFSSVDNCSEYNETSKHCSKCNIGYYLYVAFNYFLLCKENISNSSNFINNNTIGNIDNCNLYENSSGNCLNCSKFYTLFNGRCFYSINNCSKYNSSGCSTCNSGYYLSSYGFCNIEYSNNSISTYSSSDNSNIGTIFGLVFGIIGALLLFVICLIYHLFLKRLIRGEMKKKANQEINNTTNSPVLISPIVINKTINPITNFFEDLQKLTTNKTEKIKKNDDDIIKNNKMEPPTINKLFFKNDEEYPMMPQPQTNKKSISKNKLDQNSKTDIENVELTLNMTNDVTLGRIGNKIKEFINKQKNKKEFYVYEIINDSENFKNDLLQLKKIKKLGKGGFGEVFLSEDCFQNHFALKIFMNSQDNTLAEKDVESFKEMLKENSNLRVLRHKNIIDFKGIAYSLKNETVMGIVEDYMEYDLKKFLKVSIGSKDLNLHMKFLIAIQAAEALKYMHYKGLSHNDIKPENILISSNNQNEEPLVKVSDFGTMIDPKKINSLSGFTMEYASPETILKYLEKIEDNKVDFKYGDLWSFGLVLYKLFLCDFNDFNSKFRFVWLNYLKKDSEDFEKAQELIMEEKSKENNYMFGIERKNDMPENIFYGLVNLINACLQVNWIKRPSFNDVLSRLIELKTNNLKNNLI